MYRVIAILFFSALALLASGEQAAQAMEQLEASVANRSVPGPYCGVCSLHRAAQALGCDFPFRNLLNPEYISSRKGSSLSDLMRAATDQRMRAEAMGRMTCAMLRQVRCPVILHVKNDLATAKEYNHWVLFMGTEDGKARIYDGINPLELVEFADLGARWDGVGLLISIAPISISTLWLVVVAQFVLYAGACASVIAILLWLQHRWAGKLRSVSGARGWYCCLRELAVLVVLALFLGASFRWVHAGGFLSHAPSVAAIQERHLGAFLTKVKVEDVPKLLGAESVTIVDARLAQDFVAGHLEDAINIPPSFSPEQCRKALADVPNSNRILLYCQSNGCPYSEIVARKLISLGYSKILYFHDGWIAWERYQQNASP